MSEVTHVLEVVFWDRLGVLLLLSFGWLLIPFTRGVVEWVALESAVRVPAYKQLREIGRIVGRSTTSPAEKAREMDRALAEFSRVLDEMRRGFRGPGFPTYALRVLDIRTREEETKRILNATKPILRTYYKLLEESDDTHQREVGRMYMEEERRGRSALLNP